MTPRAATVSRRALLVAALGGIGGCAHDRRIDELIAHYAEAAAGAARPPLIVIPGAFGSRLVRRSTREEIWPGSNIALVFGRFREIELAIDARTLEPVVDETEPAGVFLQALGRDFYGDMLRTLEAGGGYRRGTLSDRADPSGRDYYVYDYDWRLDVVAGARGLHRLVERIAEIHGDSTQQVDIVAHSSGGLIARYYARYGTADVLGDLPEPPGDDGSHHVRRLLLVGTPSLGTIQAVLSHVRGEEIGFGHVPAEVVATCPGVPQLMPHPDQSWLVNLLGEPVGLDLYDVETWRELRWSIFGADARDRIAHRVRNGEIDPDHFATLEAFLAKQLGRARGVHEAMSLPSRPDEPRPRLFGSDCSPTLARIAVERDGETYRAYEQPHRIPRPVVDVDYGAVLNEPGDGVVTRASLLGSGTAGGRAALNAAESHLFCERHQTLTGNVGLAESLLASLLDDRD